MTCSAAGCGNAHGNQRLFTKSPKLLYIKNLIFWFRFAFRINVDNRALQNVRQWAPEIEPPLAYCMHSVPVICNSNLSWLRRVSPSANTAHKHPANVSPISVCDLHKFASTSTILSFINLVSCRMLLRLSWEACRFMYCLLRGLSAL